MTQLTVEYSFSRLVWYEGNLPLHADVAANVLAPLAWLIYALFPLRIFSAFRPKETLGGDLDTDGIAYDNVTRLKGYEMEPFICPQLTERMYRAAKTSMKHVREQSEFLQSVSQGSPGGKAKVKARTTQLAVPAPPPSAALAPSPAAQAVSPKPEPISVELTNASELPKSLSASLPSGSTVSLAPLSAAAPSPSPRGRNSPVPLPRIAPLTPEVPRDGALGRA